MESLFSAENLVALLTLIILEVVLGVDNLVFIAIVAQRLPEGQRATARRLGLLLALVGRILLVLGVSWLLALEEVTFGILGHEFSVGDVVLIAGGAFLLYKSVTEIFITTELREEHEAAAGSASFGAVVVNIVAIDIVFAIDSVLTAVGLTRETVLIIIAMTVAVGAMMFFSGPLADFIHRHPSVKILALSFLVLVGVMLVLDGFGQEVERGYVYAAILFGLLVEALNFRRRANLEKRRQAAGAEGVHVPLQTPQPPPM